MILEGGLTLHYLSCQAKARMCNNLGLLLYLKTKITVSWNHILFLIKITTLPSILLIHSFTVLYKWQFWFKYKWKRGTLKEEELVLNHTALLVIRTNPHVILSFLWTICTFSSFGIWACSSQSWACTAVPAKSWREANKSHRQKSV